jgi:hypothetical protein
MRSTLRRALATLIVLCLAVGCSDAPTAVSPDRAQPAASGGTPLAVYLYCGGSHYYFGCDAYAMGGSGSGHTFYWTNATEMSASGSSSSAVGSIQCPYYGADGQTVEVAVVVTDSNAGYAYATYSFPCPYLS